VHCARSIRREGRPIAALRLWATAVVLAAAGLSPYAYAGDAEGPKWSTDYTASVDKAREGGKDLLLFFTGSDWCPICQRLRAEVFDTEAFLTKAADSFLLVELDFPKAREQTEAVKQQNDILAESFDVQGYPTVFLTDAGGRAYAKTGYRPGGAEAYIRHLTELQAQKTVRDQRLAEARKATGLEKAKLLDALLSDLDRDGLLVGYDSEIKQILKEDADGKAGLKDKYAARARRRAVDRLLHGTERDLRSGDLEAAASKVDAVLTQQKPEPEQKQYALFLKSVVVFQNKDKEGALKLLQESIDAAPLGERVSELKKLLEEMRELPAPKE
jgi:thioredoxin-related protein